MDGSSSNAPLETGAGINRALDAARAAQFAWGRMPLAARCEVLGRAVDAFVAKAGDIAAEITWQMGRPIRHAPGEVRGFEERARYMLNIAHEALRAVHPGEKAGFRRQIKRVPLGVVAVVAPWNYPYLTAVNAVLPALIAGNTVVLKHSASNAPVRGALSRMLRERGPSVRRVPIPAPVARRYGAPHGRCARRGRVLHRLCGRRSGGGFRHRRRVCNLGPRARRQGPRLRARRRQPQGMRSTP